MVNEDLQYRQTQAVESVAQPTIATRREEGFIVSEIKTGIADAGTFNINIANNTSDISIDTFNIEYHTTFTGTATLYDTYTSAPSGGTSIDIENLLLDENTNQNDGNMEANQDVSFTGDGTHTQSVIPAAGSGTHSASIVTASTPIIEPSREVVFELTNTSGSPGDASITIVYTEKDEVYSREN